jgi:hypothetical protein
MLRSAHLCVIALFTVGTCTSINAQTDTAARGFEVTAGTLASLYQSVYSFQDGFAFDLAIGRPIDEVWKWRIGTRLAVGPLLPEAYVRLLAVMQFGSWMPSVGFEIGVTSRARFDEGKELLREFRVITEEDISPFYVAVHTTPVSFQLWDRWRLSVLELQFGTHLSHIGRTLRAQVGLVAVGTTL